MVRRRRAIEGLWVEAFNRADANALRAHGLPFPEKP